MVEYETKKTVKISRTTDKEKSESWFKETSFYKFFEFHLDLESDFLDNNNLSIIIFGSLSFILFVITLYRIWSVCSNLNIALKLLMSLLCLFPGIVLIIFILTFFINTCKNVNNIYNSGVNYKRNAYSNNIYRNTTDNTNGNIINSSNVYPSQLNNIRQANNMRQVNNMRQANNIRKANNVRQTNNSLKLNKFKNSKINGNSLVYK